LDPLNQEFKRLLELSGWSQSQAARELQLTSGAVNQYLSETTRPSLTTIKLFKLLLRDASPLPGSTEPLSQASLASTFGRWEEELLASLRSLPRDEQVRLAEHFKGIADLVAGRGGGWNSRRGFPHSPSEHFQLNQTPPAGGSAVAERKGKSGHGASSGADVAGKRLLAKASALASARPGGSSHSGATDAPSAQTSARARGAGKRSGKQRRPPNPAQE
jgi:transcriptional regulator with XRE-family HTH domain